MRFLFKIFFILLLTCLIIGIVCNEELSNEDGTDVDCGNSVVETGEMCDDGVESISCNSDCTAVSCGDGIANASASEECDDGGESISCNSDCTAVSCGDGIINSTANEECDDGIAGDQDNGCSNSCKANNVCGDGILQDAIEECDDGNTKDADGCDSKCKSDSIPSTDVCGGNGLIKSQEICSASGNSISMWGTGNTLGTTTDDFALDKCIIRGGETEWTGIMLDAGYEGLKSQYSEIDFLIIEAGSFRIKQNDCALAGNSTDTGRISTETTITSGDIYCIIFPFGNHLEIRELTLLDIKKTLEAGAIMLPNLLCSSSGNGHLIHTSSRVRVLYDSSASPAIISWNFSSTTCNIEQEGDRVAIILIHGKNVYDKNQGGYLIDENTTYKVGMDTFLSGTHVAGPGIDGAQCHIRYPNDSPDDSNLVFTSTNSDYSTDFSNGLKTIADDNAGNLIPTCDGRLNVD